MGQKEVPPVPRQPGADAPALDQAATIERVNKFWEDAERRIKPFRDQAFAYEQLTVDFSKKGFETLTYLNGGALVALPAALAFFKAEVSASQIMMIAGAFVIGLVAVVVAQVMAFFTMAKRGEMYQRGQFEAFSSVSAIYNMPGDVGFQQREAEAQGARVAAETKRVSSNRYRLAGLIIYFLSVIAFVVGSGLGATFVFLAKHS